MLIKKGHDPMEMTQKEYDETIKAKFLKKIDFVKSYVLRNWTDTSDAWQPYIYRNKAGYFFQRPIQIPANDFDIPSKITISTLFFKLIEDYKTDLKLLKKLLLNIGFFDVMLGVKLQDISETSSFSFTYLSKTIYRKMVSFFDDLEKQVIEIKLQDTSIMDKDLQQEEKEVVANIKAFGISLSILSNMNLNETLELKNALSIAVSKLEKSPFKKTLFDSEVLIGTKDENNVEYEDNRIAHYNSALDHVFYFLNKENHKNAYISLIHEYGHRFHHLFMKSGFNNARITELYLDAISGSKNCYLKQLPQIGDPLSNLREDWWTVKMASDEYYLDAIFGYFYVYKNVNGDAIRIHQKDIIKRITCPSTYGAKNEREFFAEMVSLITLGLVKPNQQVIVDKFLKIVKQDSL
jgi:hypothetical protein